MNNYINLANISNSPSDNGDDDDNDDTSDVLRVNTNMMTNNEHIPVVYSTLVITCLTFLLTSFLLTTVLHLTLDIEIKTRQMLNFFSNILQLITYTVIGYLMIKSIKKGKKEKLKHDDTTTFSSIKVNFIFTSVVILLALGDLLHNLLQFFDKFYLLLVKNRVNTTVSCSDYVIGAIFSENFVNIFYQLIILKFILNKNKLNFKLTKHLLLYLCISFIVQWISIVIKEIHKNVNECMVNSTLLDYYNQTSNETKFELFEPVLYPLAIEFRGYCLIECSCLFYAFYKPNSNNSIRIKDEEHVKKHSNKLSLIIISIIVISTSILYTCFKTISIKNSLILILNELFETSFMVVLIVICLSVILVHKQLKINTQKTTTINIEAKINAFFLLLTYIALNIYSIISILSLLLKLTNNDNNNQINFVYLLTSIVSSILQIIESSMQLIIIYIYLYNYRSCFKRSNQLLIIFNFSLWLIHTFSTRKTFFNDLNERNYLWSICEPIFVPLIIIFYLQSFFMFVKIYFKKYDN